jgi:hypothetical protein
MKTYLSHLILAVALLLIAGGAYAFWFFETRHAAETASGYASEILLKTREHERAGSSKALLPEIEAEEARSASRFVPAEEIVPFLEEIEELGSSLGATVSVVSVGDPGEDKRIRLALSIQGSFDAVMRTVGVMEQGRRASAVPSLTLDTNDDGTWTAAVTLIVLSP